MNSFVKLFALVLVLFSLQTVNAQHMAANQEDIKVVQLFQIPGEYETASLILKPGNYIFEVTNRNVDKNKVLYTFKIHLPQVYLPIR